VASDGRRAKMIFCMAFELRQYPSRRLCQSCQQLKMSGMHQ
jgi:hypothetical protein